MKGTLVKGFVALALSVFLYALHAFIPSTNWIEQRYYESFFDAIESEYSTGCATSVLLAYVDTETYVEFLDRQQPKKRPRIVEVLKRMNTFSSRKVLLGAGEACVLGHVREDNPHWEMSIEAKRKVFHRSIHFISFLVIALAPLVLLFSFIFVLTLR